MPVEGAVYKVKRTDEAGKEPTSLTFGELAVNTTDGKMFIGGPSGEIIPLITGTGSGTTIEDYVETLNGLTGALNIAAGEGIAVTVDGSDIRIDGNITVKGVAGAIQFANTDIDDLESRNSLKFDTTSESLEVPNGIVLGTVGSGYVSFGDGTTQTTAARDFTYGLTAPASAKAGDHWYHTDDGILYTYIDDGSSEQWVQL